MIPKTMYVEEASGCWRWVGRVNAQGYGYVRKVDGVTWPTPEMAAHRLAWVESHGPVPMGLCVCHTCDNPPCVRPDHLWVGNGAENHRDMMVKGRHARRSERCRRGHEPNWREKGGVRVCRTCRNEGQRLERIQARRKREHEREQRPEAPASKTAVGREPLEMCRRGHRAWVMVQGMRRCRICHAWRSRLYRAGVKARVGVDTTRRAGVVSAL